MITLPDRRPARRVVIMAAAAVVACSSGRPMPSDSVYTNPISAMDGGAAEAGPRDGAADIVATDGAPGMAGDATATTAPRCDPAHAWAPAGRVASVPQASFARFGGIGIDELSIAWTTTDGTVYVADRGARAGDFGSPAPVSLAGSLGAAGNRVALSPTGATVVVVTADQRGFAAFNRPSVGAPWSASAPLQFANVAAMAQVDAGARFSEPVLGADGASFYYLLTAPGSAPVLFESLWDARQHAWTAGSALASPELSSAAGSQRRRATGVSFDGRTLFFFDEVAAQERAAWRAAPAAPFVEFADVSMLPEAAPNYRCDTLYYRGADTAGAGVFKAQ